MEKVNDPFFKIIGISDKEQAVRNPFIAKGLKEIRIHPVIDHPEAGRREAKRTLDGFERFLRRGQNPITMADHSAVHSQRIEGNRVVFLPKIPISLQARLEINGQGVMDRGDESMGQAFHQQEPVAKGLDVMEEMNAQSVDMVPDDGKGAQAEGEHFREKTQPRGGEFKKMKRAKDSPGGGGG